MLKKILNAPYHRIKFTVRNLLRRFDRRTPIIVYQMGHVGSRSVFTSLENHNAKVFHVHHLNIPHMQTFREEYRQITQPKAENIYQKAIYPSKHVKYITLMRDPVAAAYGGIFFRTLGGKFGRVKASVQDSPTVENVLGVLGNDYEERFRQRIERRFDWFDVELKTVTGIDIFEHPFPKEEGHQVIRQGNTALLVLTIETSDDMLERAIGQFANIDEFKLTRTNTGNETPHKEEYTRFKQEVPLSAEFLDWVYEHPVMQHFYTDQQIETFRNRWAQA